MTFIYLQALEDREKEEFVAKELWKKEHFQVNALFYIHSHIIVCGHCSCQIAEQLCLKNVIMC